MRLLLLLTQPAPVLLPLQQLLTTALQLVSWQAAAAACCWPALTRALRASTVLLLRRALPAAAP
jgi:hypothetical protein